MNDGGGTNGTKPKQVGGQRSIAEKFIPLVFTKPLYMPFKFERLKVWQKSLDLSDSIRQLTKNFPKDEVYVLTSQLKRAADSIVLNIAEGSTGQSDADFKRFISYALRSDMEVVACLFIAKRRSYLDEKDFRYLYEKCEEILIMLSALKKKL